MIGIGRPHDDVESRPERVHAPVGHEEVLYVSKGEDFNVSTYYSEYEIIKYLGQGGFGKVVLGRHKKTKELVAIKIIQVD